MANPIVIDLSHWQPDPIDFIKLKENGTVGLIHKATEDTSYVDNKLFSRAKAAMDAGLCWSTYHFLRPGDMRAQLEHYGNTIDPRIGERVCLDHEDPGVSLDDLVDCVEMIRKVRADLQITIYSGHVIKDQLGSKRNAVLAENTSLWIAHYTSDDEPDWPKETWPQWSLWQYTDQASAIGINGAIDANRWNGDPVKLPGWFGPTSPTPEPVPKPEPELVTVGIQVAPGTQVAFYINGKQVLQAVAANGEEVA